MKHFLVVIVNCCQKNTCIEPIVTYYQKNTQQSWSGVTMIW